MTDASQNEDDEPIDFSTLIPASKAVEMLESLFGGSHLTKLELADRLRDRRLLAYSRRAWDSSKSNVIEAWDEEPDEDDPEFAVEFDIQVNSKVWRRSVSWIDDQASWRWPLNNFSVVHRASRPFTRVMIEDVHFDRVSIEALKSFFQGGPPVSVLVDDLETNEKWGTKKSSNGNNTHQSRGQAQAFIFLEILRMLENGELAQSKYQNKMALVRHLIAKQESQMPRGLKKTLGEEALKPLVRILQPALRNGEPFDLLNNYKFKASLNAELENPQEGPAGTKPSD